jgi:hypothetical protein
MTTFNAGSEVTITSQQVIERHTVLALIKTAEQARINNILLAERLKIEHPETADRINQPDIQAALEDRTPLSAQDFVTRVVDEVDVFDEAWTTDDRIEDGAMSVTPLLSGGVLTVEEAWPKTPGEFDGLSIETFQGTHYIERGKAKELVRQLANASAQEMDMIDGAVDRFGFQLAPGRLYALTKVEADALRADLIAALAARDEHVVAVIAAEAALRAAEAAAEH